MTLSREQRDEIWYALDAAISGKRKTIFVKSKDEYREYVAYLKDRKKRYYPKGWIQLEDKLFFTYELERKKNGGLVKIVWDPERARNNARAKERMNRKNVYKDKELKERNVLLPW